MGAQAGRLTGASGTRWALIVPPVVLTVIGILYLVTIRDGLYLGSDASLYLIHARNLAEGVRYGDTGFFVNPTKPDHSPTAYPPVLPLLLAPIVAARGLDVQAMKVELAVLLAGALAAIYLAFRPLLGTWQALAVAAVFGLNRVLLSLKDDLLADIPFLLFCFATVALAGHVERAPPRGRRAVALGVALGLLASCAFGTKVPGIVLLPSIALAELLRTRRLSLVTMVALAVGGAFGVLQQALIPGTGGYLAAPFGLGVVWTNVFRYGRAVANFWFDGLWYVTTMPALLLMSVAAGIGWIWRVRDRVSTLEVVLPALTAVVLIWPGYSGARYILPALPLMLGFACVGLDLPARKSARIPHRTLSWVLLAALFASAGRLLPRLSLSPLPHGIDRPEVVAVTSFLLHTSSTDVLVGATPRMLSLLARRSATIYDTRLPDSAQIGYLRSIRADYLVIYQPLFLDRTYLYPFINRHAGCFAPVFHNDKFDVFRFTAPPLPTGERTGCTGDGPDVTDQPTVRVLRR